jgi:uncharacterized protein YozE (UPF0346 family)
MTLRKLFWICYQMQIPRNKNPQHWGSQDQLVQQTLEYLDGNFNLMLDKADKIISSLPVWFKEIHKNRMARLAELRFEESADNYAHAVAAFDALYQEMGSQYWLGYKIFSGMDVLYHEAHPHEYTQILRIIENNPGKVVAEMEKYREKYDEYMKHVSNDIQNIRELL